MCRQKYWAQAAEEKGAAEGKPSAKAEEEVEAAPKESKKEKAAGVKEEPRKTITPAEGRKEAKKIDAASTVAKESAPKTGQNSGKKA